MIAKKKPELLAPAGDFACLGAAIRSGCDAIYFGIAGPFNMRTGANNFNVEDLPELAAICREAHIKAYLTLNVIVFEEELPIVSQLLCQAKPFIDAVICWDLSVIQICKDLEIPFHISTQASIANSESAKFYKSLGAERLVLARECTLEEIKAIKEKANIEIETFVHGAMCVAVSGRCFMSQTVFNRSASRGACLQNCRREYLITDTRGEGDFILGQDYVMSARDLCCIPFIDKVLEANVDSLKIEGRNRNPQYVRCIVQAYRRAIDAWFCGTLTEELKQELNEEVKRVYNRSFSDGFYFGRGIGEFTESTGNLATEVRTHVGKVTNFFNKAMVAEIHVQDNLFAVGSKLCFEGSKTGCEEFVVDEVWQEQVPVQQVQRGTVSLRLPFQVRRNDKVYLITPVTPNPS